MRNRPRLRLLLVALVLLSPLASAQLPTPPQACVLTLGAPASPPPVQPGEVVAMRVTAQNAGNLEAVVTITAALAGATGWSLGPTPGAQTIPPGASADFEFTLQPGVDASDQATVNFSAAAQCQLAGGASCAQLGQCTTSENTSGIVQLAAPAGFRIPGLSDFPLEWLIAGIALVAIATAVPFLLKRRKKGVLAQCPEPLKMVRAGRGTSFPIELRNTGDAPVTAAFEVSPVPEGWSAFMPLPEVQLAGREARSLWLMVRSPATAPIGDSVDVEVRLRAGAVALSSVRVRAEVQAGAEA